MTPLRALIAVLSLAMLFTISNMWTKHALAAQAPEVAAPVVDTTSVLDEVASPGVKQGSVRGDDWAEPRVDLNGNEIDDAVGDYRVDRRGEMYERHAPDTALLHLGAARL